MLQRWLLESWKKWRATLIKVKMPEVLWQIVGQGIKRLREIGMLDEYPNAGKLIRWLSSKGKPPFTKVIHKKPVGEARSSLRSLVLAVLCRAGMMVETFVIELGCLIATRKTGIQAIRGQVEVLSYHKWAQLSQWIAMLKWLPRELRKCLIEYDIPRVKIYRYTIKWNPRWIIRRLRVAVLPKSHSLLRFLELN